MFSETKKSLFRVYNTCLLKKRPPDLYLYAVADLVYIMLITKHKYHIICIVPATVNSKNHCYLPRDHLIRPRSYVTSK